MFKKLSSYFIVLKIPKRKLRHACNTCQSSKSYRQVTSPCFDFYMFVFIFLILIAFIFSVIRGLLVRKNFIAAKASDKAIDHVPVQNLQVSGEL